MVRFKQLLLLASALAANGCAAKERDTELHADADRVIYEDSWILEAEDLADYPAFYRWAGSVALVIEKSVVRCPPHADPDDHYCYFDATTTNRLLANRGGFCDDREGIGDQATPAGERTRFGTGFLVHDGNEGGSLTMMSAYHMVNEPNCDDTYIIFDYRFPVSRLSIPSDHSVVSIPAENVFECDEVHFSVNDVRFSEDSSYYTHAEDLALFSIRPVFAQSMDSGRWGACLSDQSEGPASVETPIFAAGHMLGTSLKYTFGGRVMSSTMDEGSFEVYLTGNPGMSGSFVMNESTHKVLGVLSQGPLSIPTYATQFFDDGSWCHALSRHPNDGYPSYPRATYVETARRVLRALYHDRNLECWY